MGNAKYRKLVEILRGDILSGKYGNGNPFPSVRVLIKRYGLSSTTVLHALDDLVRQGLISRKQGCGTFVTGVSPSRFIGLVIPGVAYSSEFFHPIIAELVRLARSREYTIVMAANVSSDVDVERSYNTIFTNSAAAKVDSEYRPTLGKFVDIGAGEKTVRSEADIEKGVFLRWDALHPMQGAMAVPQ